jgi:hypothetical protein
MKKKEEEEDEEGTYIFRLSIAVFPLHKKTLN